MATVKQAHVKLAGRFPVGADVELVKVRDERVLRTSAGDKVIASATVADDGTVEFTKGVEVGTRYFVRGRVNGDLREVRITGTETASAVLSQPPVGNVESTIGTTGKTLAQLAAENEEPPAIEVHPAAKQSQARGLLQRSATPLGYATPVDPDEVPPYGKQEDVEGFVQRSDTATGAAALLPSGDIPEKQEDATDGKLLQRSDTPHGVTTPIPTGDGIQATLDRDAASAKDLGGTEPGKAAGRPAVGSQAPSSPKRKPPAKKTSARKRSR